jgi:hypothetical protein
VHARPARAMLAHSPMSQIQQKQPDLKSEQHFRRREDHFHHKTAIDQFHRQILQARETQGEQHRIVKMSQCAHQAHFMLFPQP